MRTLLAASRVARSWPHGVSRLCAGLALVALGAAVGVGAGPTGLGDLAALVFAALAAFAAVSAAVWWRRPGPVGGVTRSRVLVVEDDADLAGALALELDHAGYEVRTERDGPAALRAGHEWRPELVVLDLGLPTLDGLEVCRRLRAASWAPILILTAREAIEDRVRGLDAGADDYVTKPFSLDELLARVRSGLRRARHREQGQLLRAGELALDAGARTVTLGTEPVALTRREFDLLEFFMRNPGQALDRSTLLAEVWGYDFLGGSNVVDVYVRYLRRKIERADAPRLIDTVRGIGYALRPPP